MPDTVDARIPLQVSQGPFGPDMGKMINMAVAMQRLQNDQRVMQAQNQLREMLGQPDAVDPATGTPTPATVAKMWSVDPRSAMAMQQANVASQQRQAQLAATRSKVQEGWREQFHQIADEAMGTFDEYKKQGFSDEAAAGKANETLRQQREALITSQGIPTDFAKQMPENFRAQDVPQWRAKLLDTKTRYEMERQQAADRRATRTEERGATTEPKNIEVTAPDGSKTVTTGVYNKDAKRWETTDSTASPIEGKIRETGTAAGTSATLQPEDAQRIADQYLAGDRSALVGYGRSPANQAMIQKAIRERADEKGLTGADVAAKVAEFQGIMAGERAAGTRGANLGMALAEAKLFAPMALESSAKIDRTQFPTINSIILALEKGTGDPELARFNVANRSLIGIYSQVLRRGGTPSDQSDREANSLLETAFAKGQYAAAVDQIMKEATAAQGAPSAVRSELRRDITGQPAPTEGGATAAIPPRPGSAPAQGVAPTPGPNGVFTLRPGQEQSDFDALPKGAFFVGPDGKTRGPKP